MNLCVNPMNWIKNIFPLFKYCTLLPLAGITAGMACPVENEHMEIILNGYVLTTEVAGNLESHVCGLAYRDNLPADHGMLFAYAEDKIIAFWMKNTFVPLSIAFLDVDGKILEIHEMDPDDPTHRYVSGMPVRYALEVNQGWFKEKGIVVGDTAEFDLDTGPEIFISTGR